MKFRIGQAESFNSWFRLGQGQNIQGFDDDSTRDQFGQLRFRFKARARASFCTRPGRLSSGGLEALRLLS